MRLLCAGVNHTVAALPQREALAVSPAEAEEILQTLRLRRPEAEFFLLSTCNRTELYALRPHHGHPREEELRAVLLARAGASAADLDGALYVRSGEEAVRHLFRVAAGLDSLVPGESQIVHQVKSAVELARAAGAARAETARLAAEALRTARQVRRETPIARGKTSAASVALGVLRDALSSSLSGRCVAAVGGGTLTELLLRLLAKEPDVRRIVVNRSQLRAEELAARHGAEAAPWENLESVLAQADAVLTCTASAQPILTAEKIARLSEARRAAGTHSPLLLMDLAVPRNVETAAGEIPGVRLWNLDDLAEAAARGARQRAVHLAAAEEIVSARVARYLRAVNERVAVPVLNALYRRIDETLREELAEASRKLSTHADQGEDLKILRRTLHRALRKFCHPAVETLRSEAAEGFGTVHAEAIRKLFRLEVRGENSRREDI